MKAVFLSLFCAVFLFSFVVEANLQITDSQLRYGGSSTHKREFFSSTLAFRNSFQDCNITNIALEFTERNEFHRSNIAINDTSPLEIANQTTGTTLVTITTADFDLVDEELEERGEVEIGTLALRAQKVADGSSLCTAESVTSNSIPVKLQLKNDLDIVTVEIKSDTGSFNSISEDGTVTIIAEDDYDLKFKIRNTFEASSDIELENINIQILSDDLDVDKRTTISEILADEEEEKTTSISVDEVRRGEVKVLVSGDDRFGGKHGQSFIFNFDVQEPVDEEEPADEDDADGDGVPDGRDSCLDTVSVCSVDLDGCPIDSDEDGTCDDLDPTPLPRQQQTSNDQLDTASDQQDPEAEDDSSKKKQDAADTTADSTSGFIPFLIGFAVGIMVTAGFSVLIKS